MEHKKSIDEGWKESVAGEKEVLKQPSGQGPIREEVREEQRSSAGEPAQKDPSGSPTPSNDNPTADAMEVNFSNYITSLIYQVLIFLGQIPHPAGGEEIHKNLQQAKLLIDTLLMLRDKTQNNLDSDEKALLENSLYELQMKYVEELKKDGGHDR